MTEEQERYICTKYIRSMIFSIGNIDYGKQMDFYDVGVLSDMRDGLSILTKDECLIKLVKDNLYRFLSDARDIYDEDREERLKIINEIITILNIAKEDENLTFYRVELAKRRRDIKYLLKNINEIEEAINNVIKSILYDSVVLVALTEDTTDDEFINDCLSDLSKNPFYLESINAILNEYPKIFEDLTFYNRNICVLNCLSKDIVKSNKKLIKKMDKKLKQFKK